MGWILKKKRNGSSRLTEAASFSVIIWDKGFTRPVETELPEGDGPMVCPPVPLVDLSAEEVIQAIENEVKRICSVPMLPDDESKKSTSKGFGAK